MKHIAYIHGLNSSPLSFKYLSQQLPEHTAHLISYKSHQSLGASLIEVLQQLPIDQKLTLVGHSLGGVIAALIASEFPCLVDQLVAISSPFQGSRAASTLRWIPGSMRVFSDIMPHAPLIARCSSLQLDIPTLSIITTGGHLNTSPEPNDSVISLSSQRGLRFGQQIEVNANHFEVLMSDRAVHIIKNFVFGEKP